jgi:hypothetical protein
MAPLRIYDTDPQVHEQLGRLEARMDVVIAAIEKLSARDIELDRGLQEISQRLATTLSDTMTKFTLALNDQREAQRLQLESIKASTLRREDFAWVKALATVVVTAMAVAMAQTWIASLTGHH